MKKFLAVVMTAVLAMSMMTACGSGKSSKENKDTTAAKAETTQAETIDASEVTLVSDGVLTVGAEMGYAPFETLQKDGKTPEGFDIDIITEIAKRLGLKVNFINTSFDGILGKIGKDYDVVCSAVTINPTRKKAVLFSTPYITNYQTVVVKKGSDLKINSLKDLDGKSVGVQKGTTSDQLMSEYKSTKTINVEVAANDKLLNCFTQLTNGEINAVVVDSTVADGFVAKNPDKYEKAFSDKTEPEEFGIAIGKNNAKLQEAINKALEQMDKDGFLKDTADYWFSSQE